MLAEQLLQESPAFTRRCHLISLDSRQVYQGLETLTGSDVPKSFTHLTQEQYFINNSDTVRLHGLSCVPLTDQWSVGEARARFLPVIKAAVAAQELVFLVGGTGLYHTRLLTTDPRIDVPPNEELRAAVAGLEVSELQLLLKQADPEVFARLNNSDLHNPTRLVRHIELAAAQLDTAGQPVTSRNLEHYHQETVLLTATLEFVEKQIKARVEKRFAQALVEVEAVFSRFGSASSALPATTATGFKPLLQFVAAEISKEAAIEAWVQEEVQYAKRQRTWWNSRQVDLKCDVTEPNWQSQAVAEITNWLFFKH